MSPRYHNLPVGTILCGRRTGLRLRVRQSKGDWHSVIYIRKDGEPHRGRVGWSGSIPMTAWAIERLP